MSVAVEDRPTLRHDRAESGRPPSSDHDNDPSSPWPRRLWMAIAVVVAAGTLALIFGPGRGMRSDIGRQVGLTTTQLEMTREQLEIARRQLSIADDQRKMTLESLAIAREQLAIAREQLKRSDETIQMQREALEISRATLRETREVNRKTPDANPRGGMLEGQG